MYKKEKSQALIISLWILAILTVLAISIGRQVSMALYLSKYQKNRLKAISLAKAGINRAIVELERDAKENAYDSLAETWSTGKDIQGNYIFESVEIEDGLDETFTVTIIDEDSKININTADIQLLKQLFILKEFEADAPGLAEAIFAWRDPTAETEPDREIFRNGPLGIPEELLPILEYYYELKVGVENCRKKAQEVYDKVKDLITVYGDGKININTVPRENLEMFFDSALNQMQEQGISDLPTEAETQELLNLIFDFREENKYFKNIQEIKSNLGLQPTDHRCKIIDFLITEGIISVSANNFRIESIGNVGQITKKITAVVKRIVPIKTVYWHEN